MNSTIEPSSMNHMPYFQCIYGSSQAIIPSPPSDYFVLDLSTKSKRAASPDYTYCYPSPKSSPNSNTSREECDSAKCCPSRNQAEINLRLQPAPYITSPSNKESITGRLSTECYPLPSPRSPGAISETTSEASFQSDVPTCHSPKSRRKIARPFKSLAKDSIALSAGAIEQLDSTYSTASFIIDEVDLGPEATKRLMEESAKKYAEFREKMLMQLHNNNNSTNQNMRRLQNNGNRAQDPDYLEKRKKNNESAKRSRDARRYKQDEIAIRATFLEQENMMLKYKVKSEVDDLDRIRQMELARNSQVSL